MEDVRVIHGDCLEVLPSLTGEPIAAVITDPPWGIDADTNYSRFTAGKGAKNNFGHGIDGDADPFDPSPWLAFPKIALWGAHCFSDRLPVGRWLVWLKRRESKLGVMLSDAELCWVNQKKTPRRAPGVYVFKHIWDGFDRETERGKTLHPTQKPVALIEWCIEQMGLKPGDLVLDPFAGSGTTGVACLKAGLKCILIEKDARYIPTIRRRLDEARTPLFAEAR